MMAWKMWQKKVASRLLTRTEKERASPLLKVGRTKHRETKMSDVETEL